MFGGLFGGGSTATVYGDTWVWSGTQWLELHPSTSPPRRGGSSLSYDPISKRMILYGGGTDFYAQGVDPSSDDTWAWDGAVWTHLLPAHSPTKAGCCSPTEMVYDPNEPGLWLTSGLLQMWSWTGSDWTPAPSAVRPPERFEFGLAYDDALRGVVAACGYAGEGQSLPGEAAPSHDDTWLWGAGSWTEMHPATKPAGGPCTAAYDAARGVVVVFSSAGSTWEFTGSTWTRAHPLHAPPAYLRSTSMAYDSVTHQVLLFGGSESSQPETNHTWTWDGSDWTQRT